MQVILVAAISVDGFITRHDEAGSGFTSPEDKRYFHQVVLDFDALIFGSANYELSREWIRDRLKPTQLKVVMTRRPDRYEDQHRPDELEFTALSPPELVRELRERGFEKVGLLGGGKIYGLWLHHNVVDEIWLTVEPRLFGEGIKLAEMKIDWHLELLSHEKLNHSTLLLKYRPL